MKATTVGLAIALALALQTTLARLVLGEGQIDLVLVVVVYVALSGGAVAGLWTGTVGGLAQDTLSGGIVGVSGLTKTLVGFLVGVIGSQFIVAPLGHRFVIYVAATALHAACFLGLYATLGFGTGPASFAGVIGQALANALVGVGVTVAIQSTPGMIERRRLRRASVTRQRLSDWGT